MTDSRSTWMRRVRAGLLALALLLAVSFILGVKTLAAGEASRKAAESAFDRGDLRESVRQARRSATLFVPFAPHVRAAYRRLIVVARGAEASGDNELALFAWTALRAAALESAAPAFRHATERELADKNLARLQDQVAAAQGEPSGEAEQALLRTLAARDPFRAEGFAIAALGLLLAAAGFGWVALRGLPANGQIQRTQLMVGSALVLIGVACWTLALLRA